MTTYQFFPFFLECSMKETDMIKKRHLELLAFGKAGVFANLFTSLKTEILRFQKYSVMKRETSFTNLYGVVRIFTNGKENQRASQYLEKLEEDRQAKND